MQLIPLLSIAVVGLSSVTSAHSHGDSLRSHKLEDRESKARVITSCTVANTAALTFDDGPYIYSHDIAESLKAANAKATFFLNGNNYGCIYTQDNVERVQRLKADGHQIASHTWAHLDLTTLGDAQLASEMERTNLAIKRIAGVAPAFMRPPYGSYNDKVVDYAAERGQSVVIWDFDSGDSVGVSSSESKDRYLKTERKHPKTLLALNHETYETTAHDVVPYAVRELKKAGYKLVTVAECLGEKAYTSSGASEKRTSKWTCD